MHLNAVLVFLSNAPNLSPRLVSLLVANACKKEMKGKQTTTRR